MFSALELFANFILVLKSWKTEMSQRNKSKDVNDIWEVSFPQIFK